MKKSQKTMKKYTIDQYSIETGNKTIKITRTPLYYSNYVQGSKYYGVLKHNNDFIQALQ